MTKLAATVALVSAAVAIGFAACGQEAGAEASGAAVESGYITVDSGRLFYERAGSGEVIVLLHDGMVHREVWEGQFPVFARDHTVVRYDRRGYGLSSQPETLYDNVEDLKQVFDQLKIDKATLMGMSAGGGLCLDFALKYPERVKALVLIGAVVSGYGYTDHFLTRGGRLTAADYADREKFWGYFMNDDPYEMASENTAARETMKRLIAANPQDLDDAKNRLRRQPERPALGALGEIKVPTLVMVGEYDIPDVHAHAGAIESHIPGAQRVIIPGAGHLVPLEVPDVFNERVMLLLRQGEFLEMVQSQGVEAAARAFEKARQADPAVVLFGEGKINQMGYEALQAGRLDDAVGLFRLNVQAYPESWNVYDSLGEGYAAKGDTALAIEAYEKSLRLKPDSEPGKKALEALRHE
jgi:3-oxoadipate enol-lactonase